MKKIIALVTLITIITATAVAQKKEGIGLVLSGGGALGYAHIGALQALEEHGIYPTHIAGTSMGAIIGALYAQGIAPLKILDLVTERKMYKISHLITYNHVGELGLSSHDAVKKIFTELIPHNSFDSLKLHFYACVSNIDNGTYKIVGSGNQLKEYVAASAAIPGIFEVEIIDGVHYIDGGALNNFPAQAIHNQCRVLIGVDVTPYLENRPFKRTRDVVIQSIRAALHQNSLKGRELCDFLIESAAIQKYNEANFNNYREIYQYGYKAMNYYINTHPEMVKRCKKQ
jgi:NTE family protein